MIGYVTIGVKNVPQAAKFYCELFANQGAKVLADEGRIVMIGSSWSEPMLSICAPYDEAPQHPGNGVMIAFPAESKSAVDDLYHKAISMGASCEGKPGQRMPDEFYGAYVRDPDGNKLAFYIFA